MRRFVLLLALFAPHISSAHAGMVLFDPPLIFIDLGSPQAGYEFEVTVVADGGRFDSLNILFGSVSDRILGAVLQFVGFEYSQEFVDRTGPFLAAPAPVGVFVEDLFVGGFTHEPLETPFLLGKLKLALPAVAHLSIGLGADLEVFVNSAWDGGFSSIGLGTQVEPLIRAPIPEPTTGLLLLGCVGMAFVRQKK